MHNRFLVAVVMVCWLATACSSRVAYQSTQEMQRAQCDKLTDLQDLQNCRSQARQSYDDYQRAREAVKPAE